MKVGSTCEVRGSELSRDEWRSVFRALRYVDSDGNLYEPWRPLKAWDGVRLPRGVWKVLLPHLTARDLRARPSAPGVTFAHELDAELADGRSFSGQTKAVAAMMKHEQGIVHAPPGWGKSQVALAFCAICNTRTLILVHTEDILQQWVKYAQEALPNAKVGVIRGNEQTVGLVTVATVQTFHTELLRNPKKWRRMFGCLIVDECHHQPAKTFEEIVNMMPAYYRFGFTATLTRADGRHPYIAMILGPVIHKEKFQSKVPIKVVPIYSKFNFRYRGRWDWSRLLRAVVKSKHRNQLIAQAIESEVEEGNSVLLLSRNKQHLRWIQGHLTVASEVMTSERTKADRKLIIERLRSGELSCVLATQLADEALDVPRLNRVFLVHPGKAEGKITQQVGRSIREHPEKEDAIIYDVVDRRVRPLSRQWRERKMAYKKMGIPVKKRRLEWLTLTKR